MSTALVKWRPRGSEDGRKIDTALAKLGQNEQLQPSWREQAALSPARSGGEVVDLARVCAIHGRPYAARYIRDGDGCFRHAQTIRVTEALFLGQYTDDAHAALVPGEDIRDETCPWCGASGFGSIRCGHCHTEVCYGRTTGRLFRCYCGNQGNLVPSSRAHEGVTPRKTRGGYEAG